MISEQARRVVLILAPPLLLASTWAVFQLASAAMGPVRGYFTGFLFYWLLWCLALPVLLLGRDIATLFRNVARPLGERPWLALIALGMPLLLGFGYVFPRAITTATPIVIVASILLAVVNGTLEELLWRGTYLHVFRGSWFWGWLYPTAGFAVWHFAPQSVFANPAPGGMVSLVIVAGLVGLGWGYVVRVTGTNRWTTLSHVLFDFSGLGGRLYFG